MTKPTTLEAAPAAPGVVVGVQPTQLRRPWRSTVRTTVQALIALATLAPLVASGVYSSSSAYPAVVAQVLAVSGALSRIMALPAVEEFLRRFAPWLAAAPKPDSPLPTSLA